MDMATLMPWLVLAIGGAVGGNVIGLIMRGGGGLVGRTLFGALGGIAAGHAVQAFPSIGGIAAAWSNLAPNDAALSGYVSGLITGALGGGVVGLVTGLLIRPRT